LVFVPLGTPKDTAIAGRHVGGDLLDEVRAAGRDLVGRLHEAERITAGWSDRRLAEVLVDAALSETMVRLARTECWGDANRLPSTEFWGVAGPVLEVGTLQHHARFKPHGYAGDYAMLTRICEESCCSHALGSVFDAYFLRQAAPEAVRARTQHTATALVAHCLERERKEYRVASVGSGPAIDVARAAATLPKEWRAALRVTLLDLDPAALDAARQRIEPLVTGDGPACVRTNLYRLAQVARGAAELGNPDFLVCTGFFDYLDDGPAASLLAFFWRQLAAGGRLLVGNFAPHNPSRAYMEWIGNWYLKYRTADDLEGLALTAGIPSGDFHVACERTGVDLFLVASKR
jgi:extracellular factor (EF) 3-hydroxypalmitic acid methyl ester biosynthesis protein